jgi:hypothetical protein
MTTDGATVDILPYHLGTGGSAGAGSMLGRRGAGFPRGIRQPLDVESARLDTLADQRFARRARRLCGEPSQSRLPRDGAVPHGARPEGRGVDGVRDEAAPPQHPWYRTVTRASGAHWFPAHDQATLGTWDIRPAHEGAAVEGGGGRRFAVPHDGGGGRLPASGQRERGSDLGVAEAPAAGWPPRKAPSLPPRGPRSLRGDGRRGCARCS